MWECSHIMAKSVKNKIKNYKIGMSTTIKDKLKKIITETVFDINAVVFYSTLGIAILMTIASVVIAKCRIVIRSPITSLNSFSISLRMINTT